MNLCLICNNYFLPKYSFKDVFSFKKAYQQYICPNCHSYFEKISGKVCTLCNKQTEEKICFNCKYWQKQYSGKIMQNTAVYGYNQAFHDLMVKYKRYGDYELRLVLAQLARKKLSKIKADYYVPIPTSKKHIQTRRYDTISEIFSNIVLLTPLLKKKDVLDSQGEKNRQQRLETKQSFYLNQELNIELTGKVLLLDDIYTSGRTLYHARDAIISAYPKVKVNSFTIVH